MLGALTLLALLGVRYPTRMLPLLFWEAAWKTIWLAAVPLPALIAGRLDKDTAEIAAQCAVVVLVYAAIPWPYVARVFARDAGERWTSPSRPARA